MRPSFRAMLSAVFVITSLAAAAPAQDAPATVVVSTAVKRSISAGQSVVGSVQPARRSTVGSGVDGRVVRFAVRQGEAVKRNQLLAQLRTDTLQISLRAAKAELKTRTAALMELKNGSRAEEIAQAAGELAAAKAVMQSTGSRYERAKTLHARNAMTEEQLQDAMAAFERARATHSAADARHKLLRNGPRPEQISQAAAQVAFQAEQVRLIEDQIARHTITAPFDGFVSMVHSEIGQWVSRGDAVAEVIELAAVDIEVFVLEKHLASLRVGAAVQVSVPAVPSQFFTGTLTHIVPQADIRSRSFPVRIRVRNVDENGNPLLKAGMLSRVQLPVGNPKTALLVSKDALVLGGPSPVVFVAEGPKPQQTTVRAIPVRLGVMDGDLIEVVGEIKAGDRVVVRGNEQLEDGQSVTIRPARTSRGTPPAEPKQ